MHTFQVARTSTSFRCRDRAILQAHFDRPFTSKGLKFLGVGIDKAGVPERCVTHGLWKAAARRLTR